MPLHSDQENINIGVGNNIRLAGQVGLLTDAQVVAATGVTDLKNNIDANAALLHSDQQIYAYRLKRALDLGYDDGTLTDAAVAAATSLENLASLTLANAGHYGPLQSA